MRAAWLPLVMVLFSCNGDDDTSPDTDADADTDSDADTDADTDSDTDTDTTGTCADIPAGVCDQNEGCRSVKGRQVYLYEGEYCVEGDCLPSRIGCVSVDRDCSGGPTIWGRPAAAGDDVCFYIIGSCRPQGWVDCVADLKVAPADNTCPDDVDPDECAEN